MTNFSKMLQSSVNTVVPGLFSLKACAAGSHISIAQRVSEIAKGNKQLRFCTAVTNKMILKHFVSGLQHLPAWWNPSESPPQPENTSNVRYLGTLGLGCESGCSCAAEAFPLPLPWETKFNTLGFQRLLKINF